MNIVNALRSLISSVYMGDFTLTRKKISISIKVVFIFNFFFVYLV